MNILSKSRDIIVISKVLLKTGLLDSCFTKEQSKIIKQKLEYTEENLSDDIVNSTLKIVDDIMAAIFAFVASIM